MLYRPFKGGHAILRDARLRTTSMSADEGHRSAVKSKKRLQPLRGPGVDCVQRWRSDRGECCFQGKSQGRDELQNEWGKGMFHDSGTSMGLVLLGPV